MTRDAIEKAAADAFHSVAGGTCQFVRFDDLLDIQKQTWRDGAKAAILAFLAAAEASPSEAMVVAGTNALGCGGVPLSKEASRHCIRKAQPGKRPARRHLLRTACRGSEWP